MELHPTASEIAQFRARQMAAGEILRFREHVDACDECRAKVAQGAGDAAVLRAFIDPEPDEQELVLLVAGRLTADRAAELEAHLARCDNCRGAVGDLRAFSERKAPVPKPTR